MSEKVLRRAIVTVFVLMLALTAGTVYALDTVIGSTGIDLNGEREAVRTQETNLGNLLTDAMRAFSGADIAVWNGGGIRASAKLGEITLEKAMEIFPFENGLVTLEVTGAELIEILEHSVDAYPAVAGKFLHVSGLRFYFSPNKPAGQRVLNVYVGGEPLHINKTYVLATSDFLAAGGDAYEMFLDKELTDLGVTEQQVFIRHLMENSPVFPKVEGRIVVVW